MAGLRGWLLALGVGTLQVVSAFVNGDVADKILIFARDTYAGDQASSGLKAYGIPFQVVLVPQGGITLPVLNSSATQGNYGGIITVSELSYFYDTPSPGGWRSAISDPQWEEIYAYQNNFGVRMVRIEAWPQSAFGTDLAIQWDGCCASGVEQLVKFTDDTYFPTARVKLNAGVSTIGLWHTPAVITNSAIAEEFAAFDPSGAWTSQTVAGVVNTFGDRQQMVWFMTWATDWALGPNYLQHASIHFLTRGLYVGARKTYLNTQVDDVHLESEIYQSTERFRIRPSDLNDHKSWQADLNSRLPSGSDYFVELAHNGAGDLEFANIADTAGTICVPDTYVLLSNPQTTPIEWKKPLGTGTNYWNPVYVTYSWSLACAELDDLAAWFLTPSNRNAFAHMSHTFTHLNLNNATYSDAAKEIQFNQAWMAQLNIDDATHFSPNGLVPPGISGLHNGDVIEAWLDNGITSVTGDNTRPLLRSTDSPYWPYITTVVDDGYAGLVVVPRWATSIYYNCYSPACTLQEWIDTSGGSGDFANLLRDARFTNVKHLLGLHGDPFMFHQANMRSSDMPNFTVGSKTAKMSLLMMWVETVAQEVARLTYWPIRTLKHDDIAEFFKARKARDLCNPRLKYHLTSSGTITGATIYTDGNSCSVPIPVTFPGASTLSGSTLDAVGGEPPIRWVTMSGSAKTATLTTPLAL